MTSANDLTKREYFAALAMEATIIATGYVKFPGNGDFMLMKSELLAKQAVDFADATIKYLAETEKAK